MIFVNSCNLSKSSLNACEEKGKKEKNDETKSIKRKSEMPSNVWLKILTRLTMVWK